mmetsp:Transcript_22683/g.38501  ORF Transcript_22683/g.38501 Transcript_22683/m.38501 type:complete len:677 (+) Transcript_22683:47-2077(+)
MKSFSNSEDEKLFAAFGQIVELARELNVQVQVPEVVFVGPTGSGKIVLLEHFLGIKLGDGAINRPISIQTIYSSTQSTAKITIKRDRATNLDKDKVIDVDELPNELNKRDVASATPLIVVIEYNQVWNVTLIDAPALTGKEDKDASSLALVQDSRRLIVAVEKSQEWETTSVSDFVRQVDSKGDRTVFVYTQFKDYIASSPGTRELNAWLSKAPNGAFFVTLKGNNDEDAEDLHRADMELLEQMQYDLRFEQQIGAGGVRKKLIDHTFRKYQEFVPAVLKTLRSYRADSIQSHRKTESQIRSMDSFKLRSVANNYVMNFLRSIEDLCTGTLEGLPSINGQTSAEERRASGVEWRDGNLLAPKLQDDKVPGSDKKLYGGQQFERLLSEFRAVVLNTPMPKLSAEEVAVAAGPVRVHGTVPNLAWSASELARSAVERAFRPLTEQLLERAVFILERQLNIAERILEAKRKGAKSQSLKRNANSGGLGLGLSSGLGLGGASSAAPAQPDASALANPNDFPFFTSAVKSFYLDVVNALAERTRSKCLDEFQCTQLIYWENGIDEKKLPSSKKKDDQKETLKSVNALAHELFDKTKQRLADNVILKCHSAFLVPISEHLYGEIQGKISQLTDADMENLFEVHVTIERLQRSEVQLASVTRRFEAMEKEFLVAAEQFSRSRL